MSKINTPLYINGAWRAATGSAIEVYDPKNEEVLGTVASASAAEVHEALAAAKQAQARWAKTPAAERGRFVRRAADLIAQNRDALARLISQEVGKPLSQAVGEVDFAEGF